MGEALIVRKGSEKVTVNGEKVKTKMLLKELDYRAIFLEPYPYTGKTNNVSTSVVYFNGEIHAINGCNGNHFKYSNGAWETLPSITDYGLNYDNHSESVVLGNEIHVINFWAYNTGKHYKYSDGIWTQLSDFSDIVTGWSTYDISIAAVNGKIHLLCNNNYFIYDGGSWSLRQNGIGTKNVLDCVKIIAFQNEPHVVCLKYDQTDSSDIVAWELYRINSNASLDFVATLMNDGNLTLAYTEIVSTGKEIHLIGGHYKHGHGKMHLVYDGIKTRHLKDLLKDTIRSVGAADDIGGIHIIGGTSETDGTTKTYYNDHYYFPPAAAYIEAPDSSLA